MKTCLTLLFSIALLLPYLSADEKDTFIAAYLEAHENKDTDAFTALVAFAPTTPDWVREQMIESFEMDTALKIVEIKFIPLDEDFEMSFEYEGVTYVPTAKPVKQLAIRYDEAGQGNAMITGTTYTIGKKGDDLRIISAKPRDP